MKAFHGKQKIKDKYLARVKAHKKADQIIKGIYWENGKGCAVGCTIHSEDHEDYEAELGIPQVLARLEDGIFENLPHHLAMEWPEKFLDAIIPGADLLLVWPKFAIWLLIDEKYGVIQFAKNKKNKLAIKNIADLYRKLSNGEKITTYTWHNAACAAYAVYADAEAAVDADAYAAASAAANAVYANTIYAAFAAAGAAAAAAATKNQTKNQIRIVQSEKLLELLKEAV